MKVDRKKLRSLIEAVLKEINLNTDAELFRKVTPSQPGFADNVFSRRMGTVPFKHKGAYVEEEDYSMLEEKEEESEEESLDEFSSIGGGAMGGGAFATNFGHQVNGYTLPLGMSNKKPQQRNKKSKKSKKSKKK